MVFGGFFKKIKDGLAKTRNAITSRIKALIVGRRLDAATLEQLEEVMIAADMGVAATQHFIGTLSQKYKNREFDSPEQVMTVLRQELRDLLASGGTDLRFAPSGPTVILVAGVNGAGKTTSIAKLANWLRQRDKTVLLAAGDTFRAAAVEQLTIWAQRLGIEIIRHATGADPAAVCFDAMEAGVARGVDVILIDTAGRLHTQINLMKELEKIHRVIAKKIPAAPHETLLVIDSTTGQNGVQQAKQFNAIMPLTGLILTKLDGTAKGGIVLGIQRELGIPVKFVGLGEGIDDLQPFDPDEFIRGLFDE